MALAKVVFDLAVHRFSSIHAIGPLSVSSQGGEVLGVIGANGSGKTTTFRMAVGLARIDEGRILICDELVEYGVLPPETTALIEAPAFFQRLNATENLALAADGREERLDRIASVLNQVDLSTAHDKRVGAFSQGMKQRLGIARVLLSSPKILFLDEPTNGLDPDGIAWVRNLVRDLAQTGMSVVVSSHLLDELESVATHVLVMKDGRAIAQGELPSLLRKFGRLEDLYNDMNLRETT